MNSAAGKMEEDEAVRLERARAEVNSLKEEIKKLSLVKRDKTMQEVASAEGPLRAIRKPPKTKLCGILRGHFGKVHAMHWGGDLQSLVSASQDGKLIIWNSITANKIAAFPLKSAFVLSCAFEQSVGELVACGGLDNMCSVYKRSQDPDTAPVELVAHEGYISSCRFIGEEQILTGSGDTTCILWDINNGSIVSTFSQHEGNVLSLSLSPTNTNLFMTGSTDTMAKIWDIREGKCVQTHTGHESDINSVDFFPDGQAFGTGSDDCTCRLYDMRCFGEINKFGSDSFDAKCHAIAFSQSGRLLFAGYDDCNTYAWDTLSDGTSTCFQLPHPHTDRVSCLGVNNQGDAICTGSWDTTLKIWA